MEMAKKEAVAMKKCADSATGKLGVGERLAYGSLIIWAVAVAVLFLYKLDKHYDGIMTDLMDCEARGEM